MKRSNLRWLPAIACCGLLAVSSVGCSKGYTPPAGDFKFDTFSERERSKTDDILKSIKTLTLEDAQKIALLNNPNYIAAYHSVNAAKMRYYQAFASYSPTIALNAGWSGGITDYMSQQGDVNHRTTNPNQDYSSRFTGGISASLLIFDGLSREFGIMAAKHNYSSSVALNENARRGNLRVGRNFLL